MFEDEIGAKWMRTWSFPYPLGSMPVYYMYIVPGVKYSDVKTLSEHRFCMVQGGSHFALMPPSMNIIASYDLAGLAICA